MKLATFSLAKAKGNQAKLIAESEITTKGSGWGLFLILLTSVVI